MKFRSLFYKAGPLEKADEVGAPLKSEEQPVLSAELFDWDPEHLEGFKAAGIF